MIAACHPERTYAAKGLCRPCYRREHRKKHIDRYIEVERAYVKRNIEKVRECNKLAARKKRAENRDEYRKKQREYYAKNADKRRTQASDWFLRNKYGLTREAYEVMKSAQDGVCAICSRTCKTGRELAVDHCHATGRIRGLLCSKCNRGLGIFEDSREFLERAIAYLGAVS